MEQLFDFLRTGCLPRYASHRGAVVEFPNEPAKPRLYRFAPVLIILTGSVKSLWVALACLVSRDITILLQKREQYVCNYILTYSS